MPKQNVTIERHVFFNRSQNEGENFDSFLTDLKLKARTCEFENFKDRIVGGIKSETVKARLLREPNLTLNKAENICRAAEATERQLKIMTEECEIQAVAANTQLSRSGAHCYYCCKYHAPRKCPAFNQIRHNCGKRITSPLCVSQSQ